jgi:hypothetical protein
MRLLAEMPARERPGHDADSASGAGFDALRPQMRAREAQPG